MFTLGDVAGDKFSQLLESIATTAAPVDYEKLIEPIYHIPRRHLEIPEQFLIDPRRLPMTSEIPGNGTPECMNCQVGSSSGCPGGDNCLLFGADN